MQEIEFKPSRRLGLLLIGMELLALSAIARAVLPFEGRLALTAVAFLLGWRAWRSARPRDRLRLAPEGRIQRYDTADGWRDIDVRAESFVSPALTVLRYGSGEEVRTLTLLPDSADADALRRLRASLRWAPRTRSDTASPASD